MGYTSNELVSGAKTRALYPATGGKLTDAEILRLADGELISIVFPQVIAAKGDWSVYTKTHAIASGTTRYRIPKAAHLGKLKNVRYADADGNTRDVDIIDLAHSPLATRQWSRDYFCVYVERGDVVIAQTPTESVGSLLLDYYRRPNKLAFIADCAEVSSVTISGANTRLNNTSSPAAWGTSTRLDVIQGGGTFDVILEDSLPAEVADSAYIGFLTTVLPTSVVEAGDYIAAAGYSPVPQVPDQAQAWLEQLLAVKLLESERDLQAMGLAQAKADKFQAALIEQLTPRVDGETQIMVPIYSPYRVM